MFFKFDLTSIYHSLKISFGFNYLPRALEMFVVQIVGGTFFNLVGMFEFSLAGTLTEVIKNCEFNKRQVHCMCFENILLLVSL